MVLQTHHAKVDINKAIKAVLTSLTVVCAQMCSAAQGNLENAFNKF